MSSTPAATHTPDPTAGRPGTRALPDPRLVRLAMSLYPPLLCAGVRVTRIADDWTCVEATHRVRPWNRNPNRSAFGGTLYAMTDPFFGIMARGQLGSGYRVWTSSASIEFIAPGRELMTATMSLPFEEVAAIRATTDDGSKSITTHTTEIVSHSGVLVARATQQLYVRRTN
ncbi:PaaI family thioesterase [Nocardia niigatensis]|uniref:PaaI family thioesterase n=1 Tax=Nocardia niigatensis TaxID=209249 RepID=UPI0009FCBED0|nr:DUF4442 domain-containing protein [Nocardia niigatensis]